MRKQSYIYIYLKKKKITKNTCRKKNKKKDNIDIELYTLITLVLAVFHANHQDLDFVTV